MLALAWIIPLKMHSPPLTLYTYSLVIMIIYSLQRTKLNSQLP